MKKIIKGATRDGSPCRKRVVTKKDCDKGRFPVAPPCRERVVTKK